MMQIIPFNKTIREIVNGYVDNQENGVVAFGGKLDARPPYQRELVYNEEEQISVIESIINGYPINVMYWMKGLNDSYELLDGQQRTLSICRFYAGVFSIKLDGNILYYHSLPADIKKDFLKYELGIYLCEGTESERINWFRVINFQGKKLTPQELRNSVYVGPWTNNAKSIFSKTNCYAQRLGGRFLNGSSIRQDYFEEVLKWACHKDGIDDIGEYMSSHKNEESAEPLMQYFTAVIEWVQRVFPNYNEHYSDMKGIPWGILYNKYHGKEFNPEDIRKRVNELYADWEIERKTGIFEYILSGNEKHLNFRQFDNYVKSTRYEEQNHKCFICGEDFPIEEMHADHWKPWSKGGKTTSDNCRMLCTVCNLAKSAHQETYANFKKEN